MFLFVAQVAASAQRIYRITLQTLHMHTLRRYLVLTYVSLVVYVIGIPFFLVGLVWSMRKHNKLAQPRVLRRM